MRLAFRLSQASVDFEASVGQLKQLADLVAGFEEAQRVDRLAVAAHLIVQVRTGGAAAAADAADDLAALDALAFLHQDSAEMRIPGAEALAVIDFHHPAVAAAPAGLGDHPGGRGAG